MKGHEGIIKMRQQGYAPHIVHIDDYVFESPLTDWEEQDQVPTVCVNKDALEMLDLRFLVGLKVFISSHTEERAKKLFDLCKKAGAKMVSSGHTIQQGERYKTGWNEFYHG
jgi:hypothetical protein